MINMKKLRLLPFFILLIAAGSTGCASVKGYQKNKLNDSEMELSARRTEKNEMSFQTYREGSSGANGGKTGGGCGCN